MKSERISLTLKELNTSLKGISFYQEDTQWTTGLFGNETKPVDLDLEIPDDIPEGDEWDTEIDIEEIDCE